MDVILVGDSLGMVVQGHESTLPVTVGDMVYHTANVMRVSERAMVIADMPFMSHGTPEQALNTAGRLMKEGGAHMVKIEGGAPQLDTVRHLTARAVPVCGHLGLMPQSIHQLGAYRVQGRERTRGRAYSQGRRRSAGGRGTDAGAGVRAGAARGRDNQGPGHPGDRYRCGRRHRRPGPGVV